MKQGHMTKKELKEDKLLEFFTKLGHIVRENKKLIKRSMIALVFVIIAIVGLVIQSNAKEDAATLLFEEGYSLLRQPNFRNNLVAIDKKLKEVVSEYPSTYAALKAKFYLGNIAFEMQDFAVAKKQFEDVVSGGSSTYIYPGALLSLGAIAERANKFADAIKFYDRVIESSWNAFHGVALLRKAGGLIKMNKSQEAFAVLKKLQGMQSSYYAQEASKLMTYFMVTSANNPQAKQAVVPTKKLNIK